MYKAIDAKSTFGEKKWLAKINIFGGKTQINLSLEIGRFVGLWP